MNDPQFSVSELGQKFGSQLGQMYAEIIILEKQVAGQSLTIQSMTQREKGLVTRLHDLEEQLHQVQCDILADQDKKIIDQHEK